MDYKQTSIADYTYELPENKIAFHPLEQRDLSKLLVYTNHVIEESHYHSIANHLPTPALMVFNNTRVVEARLLFQKNTGATIEIFCLEPHSQYRDITSAMKQTGSVHWMCLIGGASKWKPGQILEKILPLPNGKTFVLRTTYISKQHDRFEVQFDWEPANLCFAEVLHIAGNMPLPPYIKRKAAIEDEERYQTVYAKEEGSVAAPTAGLHFTPEVLEKIAAKGINESFVTLHVGAGTFKPVKAETMEGHEMHSEFIEVDRSFIEELLAKKDQPVIAVGTTSMRTLESLYWMGVKALKDPNSSAEDITIKQWDVYELGDVEKIEKATALEALLHWMDKQQTNRLTSTTQLLIMPGYRFRIVDYLVTNFHQPQSTLLLLVAAFIGTAWKNIYQYALENNYRFLSYGDGCLLKRKLD